MGYSVIIPTYNEEKGIRLVLTEMVVITDADGTYPNERIAELVSIAIEKGWDMEKVAAGLKVFTMK